MENLDWDDPIPISYDKAFFEKYVMTWNPWKDHDTNVHMHCSINDDPYSRNTTYLFASHPFEDYTELINQIQRHTKYTETACLHRKASKLQCIHNFPWNLHTEPSLFIDDTSKKNMNLLAMMIV
jgi:hypothetical protein